MEPTVLLTDEQLDKLAEQFKKTYGGLGEGYYERSWMYKVIEQAKQANKPSKDIEQAYETGRRNAFHKAVTLAEELDNFEIANAIRGLI
jgi:hypothetical protein